MHDRMPAFTGEELNKIHDASMDLLITVGVVFDDDEALDLFKSNGFNVNGKKVFFSEKDITRTIETAPSHFKLTARDPAKSVAIGGDDFALAPGYGASFIATIGGLQREATLADYQKFCQLVQTSKVINVNGFLMVAPWDLQAETAHLDMLYSNIVFCDKPFMGSPVSKAAARDCIDMLTIMRGSKEALKETPVTASLITPLSPFRYTAEMAGSIIELARSNQACIFGALVMAGSSGPLSLAGLLAQQTAETLAGVVLTQLVNPGAPVIVGGTSAIMDMRTGCLAMGAPEVPRLTSATIQLAKFYKLPARAGGCVTDAHLPDAQAGIESTLTVMTAIRNGTNFILHAAGILGSYSAMSFEKFIIDEELCRTAIEILKPIKITDESIDLNFIKEVGIGGDYLTHPKTLAQCRTALFLTDLVNRQGYAGWQEEGSRGVNEKASEVLSGRLSAYEKPDIDSQLETDLLTFIRKRKNQQ
ncbi:MAG: trimethylamine methyltransferase family protein [Desulfobacterales bacterium]|nr:MAG: trimethylamine methyltransferase family protein [Desulfobacterales bacterium]